MLVTEKTGLDVTCASPAAMAAWDNTVEQFLSHGQDTARSLAEVLVADPDFSLAWCAKGLFTTLLARSELAASAEESLARAEASINLRGATERERSYLEALRHATNGSFTAAVAELETVLDDCPRDSLAAKLSHAMRFMLGDARGMRESIERVVQRAGLDHPHLGYLLGCLAFALEETGSLREAARLGRRALERAPRDAWGLHAIIHVYEMTGEPAEGADFLISHSQSFEHCNNFGFHLHWHCALFYLELGDLAGALRLYDERVRLEKTDDFRDIANAVSLLVRLELAGADVGSRWDELGAIAERRITDRSLVFASLHYALALIGAGRCHAAGKLAAGLGLGEVPRDQAAIGREIGASAAEALVAFGERRFADSAHGLLALRPSLARIGGSNAQRDVFEQMLIEACIFAGLNQPAAGLLRERLGARGTNRFATDRLAWVATGAFRKGGRRQL
jgi:tetratricopeptide (TPR) repeat protein